MKKIFNNTCILLLILISTKINSQNKFIISSDSLLKLIKSEEYRDTTLREYYIDKIYNVKKRLCCTCM